ncbi:MAG: hypothetical protein ABSE73_15015 [Planctomycetota bacterium]
MKRTALYVAAVLSAAAAAVSGAEIVFENSRIRAVLGEDAVWRSITDKAGGKEYCAQRQRIAFADARVAEAPPAQNAGALKSRRANLAGFSDGKLTVAFEGCDTVLTYAVKSEPDWILFTLTSVTGTRPAELTLVRLGTTLSQHVGTRLCLGWDDAYAVALTGANLQTRGQAARRKDYTELLATTQDAPGPKLEGAAAALAGAPTTEIDALLQRLAAACNLPRNEGGGKPSKSLPLARQSYWFLSVGQKDADKVVDYCKQTGFRQVMMTSWSWCRTPGHYVFNTGNYPDGLEGLKRTVEQLHAAGILVGMHCYASKVSKSDAYVTPVPDRRFWVDRVAEIAGDVGLADTAIRTASDLREWPGSPVASQKIWEGGVTKHQEVIVDDEIVFYERIGPEGKWDTFLGCKRGAWGTHPAAHTARTPGRHYGVDGGINGYIIDQESTLLDEATTRLAEIFNTCGFDMVYFDGGEDVDTRRFDYYVSKFQAVAMSKFAKRPLVHMGTIMTHHLMNSFTRSATMDTYLNTLNGAIMAGAKVEKWPTVKDHIDKSVQYMLSVAEDRMPGELGWFGIWPKGKNCDGLQMDEIEYLMARSLAYDAPVSLETSFREMASHPLTPGLLEIVREYEELRAGGPLKEDARAALREPKKDFLLFHDAAPGGQALAEFVAVTPAEVSGGRDVRAWLGSHGGDTLAALWHYTGQPGSLVLEGAPESTRVVDVFGKPLPAARTPAGALEIPLGPRRATVVLPGTTPQAARELLKNAKLEPLKP